MSTRQRLPRKKHPYLNTAKAVMLVLTAVYPLFMTCMTGAGIYYNRSSYGSAFANYGLLLILAGVLMVSGAVLCLFRKSIANLISLFCTSTGLIMCLAILSKLVKRAKSNGWHGSGVYENVSASSLFQSRLLPCIFPAGLAVVIALCQYFSYDLGEERREKKRRRTAEENAPAASIIDD
ncbi:MAG: hypothetical protein K5884_11990 [Ruminococcus sp.]|nr:hypothetical protein [Ruminococcus sp.]